MTCCDVETGEIPFSFFFLTAKCCYRSYGWQDLICHWPSLCIGLKLSPCKPGHSLHRQEIMLHIWYCCKKSLCLPPNWDITIAIRPAAIPISGLTAMTTRVSFHPPMNPTMKPNTNVEILSMKMHTWSAMALLILLISLQRNRDTALC